MKKITYKEYTISQAENNHIMITKGEEFFHTQLNKKLSKEELKQQVENYIKLKELLDKGLDN